MVYLLLTLSIIFRYLTKYIVQQRNLINTISITILLTMLWLRHGFAVNCAAHVNLVILRSYGMRYATAFAVI